MLSLSVLGGIGVLAWIALAIPSLIFFLRLYDRTRMGSVLWLIGAVLAWPLITRGTAFIIPLFVEQMTAHGFSLASIGLAYALVNIVEALIGGILLLVAAILLERDITSRMLPSPPPPPPPLR